MTCLRPQGWIIGYGVRTHVRSDSGEIVQRKCSSWLIFTTPSDQRLLGGKSRKYHFARLVRVQLDLNYLVTVT